MTRMVNPFRKAGKWFKANLHTHTTTSDGSLSPADRVKQYREAGYVVLALTDHNTTNDTRGMSDKKILVISGTECHPRCKDRNEFHIVALNVPHGFTFSDTTKANRCIREIKSAGGLAILAHPSWCGHEYHDFAHLKGLEAFEIYNTTCESIGRGCSETQWSYAAQRGMVLPIVGVDDAHHVDTIDVFGCWTWLRMSRPTPANVLKAIRTGACYASCGPRIHDFRVVRGEVSLRCSPAAKIAFVTEPTLGAVIYAKEGKTITTFSVDYAKSVVTGTSGTGFVSRPAKWKYVRAVVTDAAGRQAWTNPIML